MNFTMTPKSFQRYGRRSNPYVVAVNITGTHSDGTSIYLNQGDRELEMMQARFRRCASFSACTLKDFGHRLSAGAQSIKVKLAGYTSAIWINDPTTKRRTFVTFDTFT
jgi:hypothetical protein